MEAAGDVLDALRGESDGLYAYFFTMNESERCRVMAQIFAMFFERHPQMRDMRKDLCHELAYAEPGKIGPGAEVAAERDFIVISTLCFVNVAREAYVKSGQLIWSPDATARARTDDGASLRSQFLSKHVMPAVSHLLFGDGPPEPHLVSIMRKLRAEHSAWSAIARL